MSEKTIQVMHLAGARPRAVHLGHRRDHGAVDALVALDDVLGEEAAGAKLRHAQGERPHARPQLPLAVAVPAVSRRLAHLVGLGGHHAVHYVLGHPPE
jgi:hypothetical protein